MRTKDQIKRKLIELRRLLVKAEERKDVLTYAILDGQTEILEWVLNNPKGKYHL